MSGTRIHLAAPPVDLAAGCLAVLIGAAGLRPARDWPLGTPTDPGSGAFPALVCLGLIALGIWIGARSLIARSEARLPLGGGRPMFIVTLSVTLFALLLDQIGLFAAILILVLIADRAGARPRPLVMAIFGAGLAGGCVLLFVQGLGMPIRVWP